MKKNVLVLAAAVCMAAALTACGSSKSATETTTAGAADTTAAAAEKTESTGGKIVMVTNAEFPPYEYHENDTIVGIDADIARAVAEQMGMELEIQDMAFDSLIPAIQSGKADFAAAGMTVNEDRLKNVDFTDTYAQAAQVIIVTKDSPIASPDDLTGKKIGVQTGTTGDIYADDVENAEVQRFNKGMEAVMALNQGKIDAVIIDREPAKVFVKENEGLKILDEAFTEEEYAIAVKKGNTELLEAINATIARMQEDGTYESLVNAFMPAGGDSEIKIPDAVGTEGDKTIKMGTNAAFKPFEYVDGTEVVGFDISMAQQIAQDMGAKLQVEDMAFDSLISALDAGAIDFVAAGMTATEERRQSVDFSDPYYSSKQVIILKK